MLEDITILDSNLPRDVSRLFERKMASTSFVSMKFAGNVSSTTGRLIHSENVTDTAAFAGNLVKRQHIFTVRIELYF